jgi:hypothetical protein
MGRERIKGGDKGLRNKAVQQGEQRREKNVYLMVQQGYTFGSL